MVADARNVEGKSEPEHFLNHMPPTLTRYHDLLRDDAEARRDNKDPVRTYNYDKTCSLDRVHMTEASRMDDQENRKVRNMPLDRFSRKITTVIAPTPVTLTILKGDSRKAKKEEMTMRRARTTLQRTSALDLYLPRDQSCLHREELVDHGMFLWNHLLHRRPRQNHLLNLHHWRLRQNHQLMLRWKSPLADRAGSVLMATTG
jgi:hypothetical protein